MPQPASTTNSATQRPRNRRALLRVAAVSLSALAAERALHPESAGATSSPMNHGDTNTSDATTELTSTALDNYVLKVENKAASGDQRTAVYGYLGTTAAPAPPWTSAVLGISTLAGSWGVYGEANGTNATGVFGRSDSWAVYGQTITGTGVVGEGAGTGTGVYASSSAGIALSVVGRGDARADIDEPAFKVQNRATSGEQRTALYGFIGDGVPPTPSTPAALLGVSAVDNSKGVHGVANGASSMGVYGEGNGTGSMGVYGRADGNGVFGVTTSGFGVVGEATGSGVGVYASSGSGVALKVDGAAQFEGSATFDSVVTNTVSGDGAALTALNASNLATGTVADIRLPATLARTNRPTTTFSGTVAARKFSGRQGAALALTGSGTGAVPKNKSSVRITTPLCKARSKVLVTLQSRPGGAAVSHVKPGKGFFDVFLTANTTVATKFAYLVLA